VQADAAAAPAEELPLSASGGQAGPAIEAVAAAGRERCADAIAHRELSHGGTCGYDPAHELVPHHCAGIEAGFPTEIGMQVRAAQAGKCNLDDDVAWLNGCGIGHRLNRYLFHRLETDCFHLAPGLTATPCRRV